MQGGKKAIIEIQQEIKGVSAEAREEIGQITGVSPTEKLEVEEYENFEHQALEDETNYLMGHKDRENQKPKCPGKSESH